MNVVLLPTLLSISSGESQLVFFEKNHKKSTCTIYDTVSITDQLLLKRYDNDPNFPMFSHNSGQHRFLTLPFEPFRFWLRIRGDILI